MSFNITAYQNIICLIIFDLYFLVNFFLSPERNYQAIYIDFGGKANASIKDL